MTAINSQHHLIDINFIFFKNRQNHVKTYLSTKKIIKTSKTEDRNNHLFSHQISLNYTTTKNIYIPKCKQNVFFLI